MNSGSGTYRLNPGGTPILRRGDWRGDLWIWWREIDRVLLSLVIALMAFSTLAVAAASPASAQLLSKPDDIVPPLRFFWPHLIWLSLGFMTMLAVAMMPRRWIRRGAIVTAMLMVVCLLAVPLVGSETNGARRWLELGIRFQPSEFAKPAVAITLAWIMSWRIRQPSLPVISWGTILHGLIVILLMLQPNFGDAVLFTGVWFVAIFLIGLPLGRVLLGVGGGITALFAAYLFYENARNRIDAFLGGGTAFDQVDLAARTLTGGGWTGTGMRLGSEKMRLPEAHTDYIFSVIGEEFGLVTCAMLVVLYLAIIGRALSRLMDEEDVFALVAGTCLTALVGGQAFINILVNLQLFPSKGMTLPLVSYGGSSTIAVCATFGAILALTRRNPFVDHERFDWRALLPKWLRR